LAGKTSKPSARNGLRITHIRDVEPFTVKPRALHLTRRSQLAKEAPIDIAFVCMKSYDTAWATTLIKQYWHLAAMSCRCRTA